MLMLLGCVNSQAESDSVEHPHNVGLPKVSAQVEVSKQPACAIPLSEGRTSKTGLGK